MLCGGQAWTQDIEEKVKGCAECQCQHPSPPLASLSPWQWPSRPRSRVHVDFLGPFKGHMILLLIDAHSKWMEVHPMPCPPSLPKSII